MNKNYLKPQAVVFGGVVIVNVIELYICESHDDLTGVDRLRQL